MILTCNDDRDDPQVIFFLCWKLRKLLSPWLLNYECAFYTYIGFADFEFFFSRLDRDLEKELISMN